MPVYEYVCENNHKTSQVRSINLSIAELEKSTCECGASAELAVSMPGRPILLGQGFHQNDYPHGRLGS